MVRGQVGTGSDARLHTTQAHGSPSDPRRETGKFTQQTKQAGHIFVLLYPMHQIIMFVTVTNFILFTATLNRKLTGSQKGEVAPEALVQEPAAPRRSLRVQGTEPAESPNEHEMFPGRWRDGPPGDPKPDTEPGGTTAGVSGSQPHSGGRGRQAPAPSARRAERGMARFPPGCWWT